MLRSHVILAVFKRNVASYFSGVLGYLFIVAFVVAGSLLAFKTEFFAANQCNLDQLSGWFPLLLVFIVPAITMTAWADERKLGTDELLFTLPATDVEILLGKYLAVLAVYSVALLFSLTHALVLATIGDPDQWQVATTYFGYWLAGSALISAGLFASVLTSSATVAFVLGAVICAAPVGFELIPSLPDWVRRLTIGEQLREFTLGIIPLSGLVYFLSLTGFMLYLNVVMIGRRHWGGGPQGTNLGLQYIVRAVALAATLISVNYMARTALSSTANFDMTQEHLFTLSDTTATVLENIDKDKPVTIQAYLSPQVPDDYADTHRTLQGLLRKFDDDGGAKVNVQLNIVDPSSEEAERATQAGIAGRTVQSQQGGKITVEEIFLGALVQGPYAEVVIPFFDKGTAAEYELTRAIGTVTNSDRKTIGILSTDAKLMGGFDMRSFRQMPEWRIVQELKKQYKVEDVTPDSPITTTMDVLIAVMPSSLTEPQMENFLEYVKSGKPVLIFDDPLPSFNIGLAPLEQKPAPGGGMMGMQQPPEPKADGGRLTRLMELLGCKWESSSSGPPGEDFIVFDQYNPHAEYAEVWAPEIIFITPSSGNAKAFNPDHVATRGLQEVVAIFSGTITPDTEKNEFTRLLLTGAEESGLLDWSELTEQQPFFGGLQLRRNPPHIRDQFAHAIAAEIRSKKDAADKANVIFVADADIISDNIFRLVEEQLLDIKFDNVTFVMNAVDSLAGDDNYIELRKRRAQLRTLERVEQRKKKFETQLSDKIKEAEAEAKEKLDKEQKELDAAVKKIQDDPSLDPQTKEQMTRIVQRNAQDKFDADKREIEQQKQHEIERQRNATEREVRTIEDQVWLMAVLLPPIPAVILMAIVLSVRLMNETTGVAPERMVKR
jgi:ABC-2 type transport system permease protein